MKASIARGMYRIRARICDFLNKSSKNWSVKKLKVYWFLFVLSGMAMSLEICMHAIRHAEPFKGFVRPHITLLCMPRSLPDFNQEDLEGLLSKIKAYEVYLNKLSIADSTKYKTMLKAQPFLQDSLRALETLLSQHLKK